VLTKASHSRSLYCIDVCVLLCSDDTLNAMKLVSYILIYLCLSEISIIFMQSDEWINKTVRLFTSLLETGNVVDNGRRYKLLDFILPIANLSVLESHKGMKKVILIILLSTLELIGNHVVSLLLRVVFGDHIDSMHITPYLSQGKQEASKVFPPSTFLFMLNFFHSS
jgi:hypothetical protein